MREALARADHDFVLAQPSRRRAQEAQASRFSFLLRRPGRIILFVTSAGVLTGIVLNAVMFQSGPHPAPLFGLQRAQQQQAQPMPAAPRVPSPPPRAEAPVPVPAPASAPAPALQQAPAPAATPAQAAPAAASPAPARKDPIAMLLNGETPVENPARVLAAQKALIKAGFVLKADGVMGSGTRQAIEGFERERKLPVTGELNPRTLRELSQRTGIAIP